MRELLRSKKHFFAGVLCVFLRKGYYVRQKGALLCARFCVFSAPDDLHELGIGLIGDLDDALHHLGALLTDGIIADDGIGLDADIHIVVDIELRPAELLVQRVADNETVCKLFLVELRKRADDEVDRLARIVLVKDHDNSDRVYIIAGVLYADGAVINSGVLDALFVHRAEICGKF